MASGNRMLIGPPRLAIIDLPTSRKVWGVIDSIERLRLNQVPQNTPETSVSKNRLMNWAIRSMSPPLYGHLPHTLTCVGVSANPTTDRGVQCMYTMYVYDVCIRRIY